MQDYSPYAGRWVALDEDQTVAGVGTSPEAAQQAGRQARPKARLRVVRITATAPHLALPAFPLEVIRPLLHDEQLWLVGGAVRDLLLQRPPHDWDFAVQGNATPLARRCADALHGAFVLLDAEHDTARVLLYSSPGSLPITLDFTALRGASLEEDLRARDFTLNAMALTLEGVLIDPTGGQQDLAARRIRVTSDASFTQDPARLLRAIRTAAELDFHIEPHTLTLLQQHTPAIENVAPERIRAELLRILQTAPATVSLRQTESLGLLARVLPEIAALRHVEQSRPHHYAKVLDHTYAVLSAVEMLKAQLHGHEELPRQRREVAAPPWAWPLLEKTLWPYQTALLRYLAEPVSYESTRGDLLQWSALFHDAGKADTRTVDAKGVTHFYGHAERSAVIARHRLGALRFANKAQEFVATLVQEHMRLNTLSHDQPPSRRAVYRYFRDTQEAGVATILLSLSDILAVFGPQLPQDLWQRTLRNAEVLLEGAFKQREIVLAPPPLLNGHDLQALGVPAGPQLGALLEQLREAQAAGEIQTREAAVAFIRATFKSAALSPTSAAEQETAQTP